MKYKKQFSPCSCSFRYNIPALKASRRKSLPMQSLARLCMLTESCLCRAPVAPQPGPRPLVPTASATCVAAGGTTDAAPRFGGRPPESAAAGMSGVRGYRDSDRGGLLGGRGPRAPVGLTLQWGSPSLGLTSSGAHLQWGSPPSGAHPLEGLISSGAHPPWG